MVFPREVEHIMRQRKRSKIYFTIGVILILVTLLLHRRHNPEQQIVMCVDTEPVTVREFMQRMEYEYRAITIDYFTNKYDVAIEEDFWNQEFDGITPKDYLINKTTQACTEIKIQELEMKKMGLLEDISYSSFLDDLQIENQRRKEIIEEGGVIYGPEQYSENEYFEYVFGNLKKDLKNKMADTYGWLEEKELKKYYDKNKEVYYKTSDDIEILKLVVPYDKDTRENLYQQLHKISMQVSDRLSFEKEAGKFGKVTAQSFTEESARTDSRYYEVLKLAAMKIPQDSVSNVLDDGENLAIIYCVAKKEGDYITYEQVAENVIKLYVDDCYEKWLEKRTGEVSVELKNLEELITVK